MDKRAHSLIASPKKVSLQENNKKLKLHDENQSPNCLDELAGLCFDDDDEGFFKGLKKDSPEPELDLSTFKRCRVIDIECNPKKFEKILHLKENKSSAVTKCCLKGPWYETDVSSGDIASVQGIWNEEQKLFVISANSGFIITSPDTLVSGTTVVGSLFCTRKSILSERFRGIDAGDSKIMNIGSIVHEIMQKVLKKNLTTLKEIKQVAENHLSESDMIHLLYSCKMTLDEIRRELEPFLTNIFEFMRRYIVGDNNHSENNNSSNKPFDGRISEILDIEENVWSPRLGMKGKIDVTVKIHPPNSFLDVHQKLLPLEIKTGRPSFSLEHKGQLIIYQMMMQDLGKQIDSGLLLYIRDGLMSEIKASHPEKRGLIMLRNRLASFLSMDIVTSDQKINLPEPINHHSACGKCPYNTLCCTFLKKEKKVLSNGHPLREIQEKIFAHLSDDHVNYFFHWCHLITSEHNEVQRNNKLKHLWTKEPEARAAKGKALINLIIKDIVQPQRDEFSHKFGAINEQFDFTATQFDVGDYLIVSTSKRCSVAAGRVTRVESNFITMALPRDLSQQYEKEKFHLDHYESQSQTVFNFTNIGVLLDDNEKSGSNRLRQIIIDKVPAKYGKSLPKMVMDKGEKILLQMNLVQRKAVLKALTCENFMLIKGLPGTGKTQTLVGLIQLLRILKKSILITSHTNSAVDNILLRLKERGIKFLRLGSTARIHPSLLDFSEASLVEKCKTVDELELLYNQHDIVAVTCLGSAHSLLSQRKFDYCLVDEATQIFQPTVIRPLLSASKFILVGDPAQLSPLVKSAEGKKLGADESLFERLDSPEATTVLGLQYRMNRIITKLANDLTYNGALKCADDEVEKAVMKVPNIEMFQNRLEKDKWLAKVLSPHIEQSSALINTGDVFKMATQFAESIKERQSIKNSSNLSKKNTLYVNYCEIAIVLHIVNLLTDCGVPGDSIGIIAPYRGQVDALKSIFVHHGSLEVNTVDQYQGRDKKVIIYSCTQSETNADPLKTSSEVEILEDRRRLTVAITRAKQKLIMIGDVNCLNKYTPFKDLFKHMSSMSKISIQDGKFGFSWSLLTEKLISEMGI